MTSVQEIYERNLRRQYTTADAKQFEEAEKGLAANRLDVKGPGATRNLDLIDEFFQTNRGVPVTLQNIYRAVEERKSEFAWLSPAEAEWYQTAQQNLELGNQLAAHLATHGQVGRLVNDGDLLFENLTLLFTEIHSRRETVSPQTIAHAENRIAHRPGRQLHRVAQPRRTEPQSANAKADDGTPFVTIGLTKQRDGSLGKSPADYAREAREAAAKNNPSQAESSQLDASEATWKNLADGLLSDGTHSQQERVRAVYDREQGSGWRKVYEACQREINLTKNRSVR